MNELIYELTPISLGKNGEIHLTLKPARYQTLTSEEQERVPADFYLATDKKGPMSAFQELCATHLPSCYGTMVTKKITPEKSVIWCQTCGLRIEIPPNLTVAQLREHLAQNQ